MIYRGLITSIPTDEDYKYKVRVTQLEDNTSNISEFEALASVIPGSSYGYNPGDVVYVGFEDHELTKAVILGKLFTTYKNDNLPNNKYEVNTLVVSNKIELPPDAKLGEYSSQDIFKLFQGVNHLLENSVGGSSDISYEEVGVWNDELN